MYNDLRAWYDQFCKDGGVFGTLHTCPHPYVTITPWLGHNKAVMEKRGIELITWLRQNVDYDTFILVNQHENNGSRYCTYDNYLKRNGSIVGVVFMEIEDALKFKLMYSECLNIER